MRQWWSTLRLQLRTGLHRSRWQRAYGVLAAVCCVYTATAALGLGLSREERTIARSGDGKSTLQLEYQRGPEGGGITTYRLVTPAGGTAFLVSSDLSPGSRSRPQRVTVADCTSSLTELDGLLRVSGFSGVTVHPERCKLKSRSALVSVSQKE